MNKELVKDLKEILSFASKNDLDKIIPIINEKISKYESDFIGVYHPYPKEAPFKWRMQRMKELRKLSTIRKKRRKTLTYKISKLLKYSKTSLVTSK